MFELAVIYPASCSCVNWSQRPRVSTNLKSCLMGCTRGVLPDPVTNPSFAWRQLPFLPSIGSLLTVRGRGHPVLG